MNKIPHQLGFNQLMNNFHEGIKLTSLEGILINHWVMHKLSPITHKTVMINKCWSDGFGKAISN